MQTKPETASRVVVIDGTPEAQQWLDTFIHAAQAGTPGDWPHPHAGIPGRRIKMSDLVAAIAMNFADADGAWSIADRGFPPPPGGEVSVSAGAANAPRPPEDPSKGSAYHNLLHSLLGDFH